MSSISDIFTGIASGFSDLFNPFSVLDTFFPNLGTYFYWFIGIIALIIIISIISGMDSGGSTTYQPAIQLSEAQLQQILDAVNKS